MADNINYIPQVDYTSRDYTSIREDLLNLIPQYNPNWTSRDPSDLGMTLVELFAYMGDLMSFYVDRSANEAFLSTASQRDSVLQLAYMLGYVPSSTAAATVSLTFSNNNASSVVIPAKTKVATTSVVNGVSTQIVFETDSSVTVPAKSGSTPGSISVSAAEGETTSLEKLGISSGSPSQIFKLNNIDVIGGSIYLTIAGNVWTYIQSLMDADPFDTMFSTATDTDGNTFVIFGDGLNGKVPPSGATIEATYRTGYGTAGNVSAGLLTNIISSLGVGGISVTNSAAATGGADEESTDSVRLNAPRALRAHIRAVSLKDYAYLSLQINGVAKASADANGLNSVVLYIAPTGDPGISAGVPTAAFTALADKVALFFMDKTPPNSTLTILPPTYVPVNINATVHILPQYQQSLVISKVNAAISDLVSIENSFFADVMPAQFILNAISSVNGVDYATIEHLRKNSSEQSFTVSTFTRTSNVAQLTTSATHNITVGQTIKVTNTTNGTNNVDTTSAVVTAVGSTTISYTNTGSNVTTATPAGTATVQALAVETISCAVNEIPSKGTFTLTGVGGIS